MIVFPLTRFETRVVRWATRLMPILALVVIALLGAFSIANAAW